MKNKTQEVIFKMLQENRNATLFEGAGLCVHPFGQDKRKTIHDFLLEPPVSYSANVVNGRVYTALRISVFHFLNAALSYDSKLDSQFQTFLDSPHNAHVPYIELMQDFAEQRVSKCEEDYFTCWTLVSTENYASPLSQPLRYVVVDCDLDPQPVVLLQIYNTGEGCGGYTRPRAFFALEDGEILAEDLSANLWCPSCKASWSTDDGGLSWNSDFPNRFPDLSLYTAREISEAHASKFVSEMTDLAKIFGFNAMTIKVSDFAVVFVSDGKIICPVCHTDILTPRVFWHY
ncbi:MAG: hypothetical protein QXS68_02985 [Candidatus Methanomethylicaceae archaeon]